MAQTAKTFSVAGTSKLNGITKIRFANDFVSRVKILAKNKHDEINLIELGGEFTKAEVCQILVSHPQFQGEEAQGAIHEYVMRNAPQVMKEIEAKMAEVEDKVTA